jgi:hypothetical protein
VGRQGGTNPAGRLRGRDNIMAPVNRASKLARKGLRWASEKPLRALCLVGSPKNQHPSSGVSQMRRLYMHMKSIASVIGIGQAGGVTPTISLALSSLPALLSSSNNFEIGSREYECFIQMATQSALACFAFPRPQEAYVTR